MADKSKTIKDATDQELGELISRLRREREIQSLISDIKRNSSSGYMPYDYGQEISTEKPIESLYHFGIPGMHWGVRRSKINGASSMKKKSKPDGNTSEDHKTKKTLLSKRVSEMSNAELRELTTRLQLEKQYKDLTNTQISAGKKWVTAVFSKAAKTTATVYVAKYMGVGVAKLFKTVSN